jgi:DNA polymerase III delta' subunit
MSQAMFGDVLGQVSAKKYLSSLLENDRHPSGLLFYGPRRTGKFALAHSFVKVVNCTGNNSKDCTCSSCRKIDEGYHPDVTVVKPNEHGHITIDKIRQITRNFELKQNEGRRKAAIIKNADLLGQEAANALLKTLEEPRGNATIVLTTYRYENLLDTIRSRCQPIRFGFLADTDIATLAARDTLDLDPVALEMMGGMYLPELIQDDVKILKYIWDGSDVDVPDKIEADAVKLELTYICSVLSYLLRKGRFEYKFIMVHRANSARLSGLFNITEQAMAFIERGTKPFLVVKWYEHRIRGALR